MIEQAELNRAFFARYGDPIFLEGMASRAELFFPKARAKTEPSRAELRLGPNTTILSSEVKYFYTDLPYVFLHRVLHRFTEHISTQISTQICVTSLYTELYTESKYICTYFFQSSTHSWKTLLMSFFFCLCNSFFEDSAISIPF